MQTCKTCGKSNDDVDFYASIKTYCKEHWKDKVKANRAANSDYYKAFDKSRANQPERIAARKEYQKTIAFKESHLAANELYRKKFPHKRKATNALNKAIFSGKICKHACFVCGEENSEAHHPDYDSPLDVIWLCDFHHKQTHILARSLIRKETKVAA